MMESTSFNPSASYTDPTANHALAEAQKSAQQSRQGQINTRNTQILEASLQVSIQSGNDGLSLLYRTAVDEINRLLEPELGAQAIETAAQNQDNSPQATAGRIVSMSTAMFRTYAAMYPDKSLEEVANAFVATIRAGFEQGYAEAEKILQGLGVLGSDSEVAQGIATTFELVQRGFDDWLANQLQTARTPDAATAKPAPASEDDSATP